MKLVGVQHGPATVTGEQTSTACHCLQSEAERPGVRRDPEVRILRRPHNISDRDEEPEKEAQYAEAWGWFTLGGVLLIIFAVLYCNGALLAPLVGESACANNYLHKVFHDGRHLLGVLAGLVAGLTAGPSPTLSASAIERALLLEEGAGELKEGDRIVFTGGVAGSMPGSTNLLQVHTLGDEER